MAVRTVSSAAFLDGLRRRGGGAPVSAMFELTHRCTYDCVHCYVPQGARRGAGREVDTPAAVRLVEQAAAAGVREISFTGGECFVRPDALTVMRRARAAGMVVDIMTNASLVDDRLADGIAALGPRSVAVTWLAARRAIFARLSRRAAAPRLTADGVERLLARGVPVRLKTPALRGNRGEPAAVNAMARARGLLHAVDTEIFPSIGGVGRAEIHALPAAEAESVRRACHPEMYADPDPGRRSGRSGDAVFACGAGRESFLIDPAGRMHLCVEIRRPGYDAVAGSVARGLAALAAFREGIAADPAFRCGACGLVDYCVWCPGRSFLETGTFTACSPYFRALARSAMERVGVRRRGAEPKGRCA